LAKCLKRFALAGVFMLQSSKGDDVFGEFLGPLCSHQNNLLLRGKLFAVIFIAEKQSKFNVRRRTLIEK